MRGGGTWRIGAARVALAAVGLALALGPAGCGAGDPEPAGSKAATPTPGGASASSATGPTDPATAASPTAGTGPLIGRWRYQGDFPADVASLTVEPDGSAVFFAEGDPITYRGTVEPVAAGGGAPDRRYRLKLTGTDTEFGGGPRSFTMVLRLAADGDSFTATIDGHPARTFTRTG